MGRKVGERASEVRGRGGESAIFPTDGILFGNPGFNTLEPAAIPHGLKNKSGASSRTFSLSKKIGGYTNANTQVLAVHLLAMLMRAAGTRS
jgi:hypothetical protein